MRCRNRCFSSPVPVLDLGMHYLPDFTEPDEPRGPRYPLKLMFCPVCTLVQLERTTPRAALYHKRYGFKSGVNEAVRNDLAGVVKYALGVLPNPRNWLDIACNDGTLLAAVPGHIARSGIDPLSQFAAEAALHAERLISDYFRPDYFEPGEFDVITSVSMFYDLDDPGEFARGVARVLGTRGIWVIQQNYAADMLTRNAVDNICHEHVTYFSVRALIPPLHSAGLEVNDVTYSDVNGGCVRTLVSHRGAREVKGSVSAALARERRLGLDSPGTFIRWGERVTAELEKTGRALREGQAAGLSTWLYGASTRGGTILQMIGAGPELLPFAVERRPAKVGKIMAAAGIPVISEEQMRAAPPDRLLVTPWFFRDVFVEREHEYLAAGGQMIFPLPRFEITGDVHR